MRQWLDGDSMSYERGACIMCIMLNGNGAHLLLQNTVPPHNRKLSWKHFIAIKNIIKINLKYIHEQLPQDANTMPFRRWKGMADWMNEVLIAAIVSLRMYLKIRIIYYNYLTMTLCISHFAWIATFLNYFGTKQGMVMLCSWRQHKIFRGMVCHPQCSLRTHDNYWIGDKPCKYLGYETSTRPHILCTLLVLISYLCCYYLSQRQS